MTITVTPAQAGVQTCPCEDREPVEKEIWIPAFAGLT